MNRTRLASEVLAQAARETRFVRLLAQPAPVTWTLLVLLPVVHVLFVGLAWRLGSSSGEEVPFAAALAFGWKSAPAIGEGQWWRLVTPMFLHGNLLHLAVNGYALFALGPLVERLLGSARFGVLFVVSAVLAAICSLVFTPMPAVGASGAIFGLIGASMVTGMRQRAVLPPRFARMLVFGLLPWVLLNLIIGWLVPQVDNAAHIGGLLAGAAMAAVFPTRITRGIRAGRAMRTAAGVVVALCVLSMVAMTAEIVRCGGSLEAFEACYRAQFEAAAP